MSINESDISIIIEPGETGMTARGALRRSHGVSQRLIRKIANSDGDGTGSLYINGRLALFKDRVKEGDEIRLVFPEEESWIEPQDIPLSVLYEDDTVIAIDKPPGIVVHPTKGHRDATIANAIVFHMRQRGESYKPRFASRLDMDTSGVLLVGKNSHAQDSLAKQGAAGTIEKIYIAVLDGNLTDDLPPEGIIDLPVGLLAQDAPQRGVIPDGQAAKTAYEVTGRGTKAGGFTVVRARLITGRTHQIRVHFAHFGHPVLGDTLYGRPSELIGRQALHAISISFTHPVTGVQIKICSPVPADIPATSAR